MKMAVLVAISIPIFTTQLEKSRESTDAANLRAAYAEQSAALLTWDGTSAIKDIEVVAQQTQAGWQNGSITEIGGIKVGAETGQIQAKLKKDNGKWTVKVNIPTDGTEASVVIQ